MAIPVVDLAEFSGNPQQKAAFVDALGKAYEEVGFVAVKNHGIPATTIEGLYSNTREFFSQPAEVKKKYEIAELAGQRGYTSFGKEHAKGSTAPDLKEFFQFGQIVDNNAGNEPSPNLAHSPHSANVGPLAGAAPADPIRSEYPDNVIVSEISSFNPIFSSAYRFFENSGLALLRAIALYLGLDEKYFDDYVHNGNSILRAIHYPPIKEEPKSAIRAEQHEDINLITLLIGASADGLEILSKQNEWVPVTSLPEQIVVNVGDMLQRLTNNQLRSTTHRVVNPPRELWGSSRFSIPFFLHPKSSMSLACLPGCIDSTHPKAYPDATAGEYLDERLREIGLKK
jgi:isopenicillin N synthase-like dioxygenase